MIIAALLLSLAGSVVQGTVRSKASLEPIPGAVVTVPELRRAVTADAKGYFVVSDLPEGRWRIEASGIGHTPNAVTVVSNGSGVIRIDFELTIEPIRIRDLEVRSTHYDSTGSTVRVTSSAGPPAVRIDAASLKLQPGLAEPDVLRALQVLPSVGSMSDFSSALYVRGGAGDQNLITLDGMPLFNPYHLGGVFSAISTGAVSSVDVWAGGQPARARGDRLSSTVAIHTRDGGRDRMRAEGSIGLISTQAVVDGPLPGRRGAYLVSGRRTYIDAVSAAAHRVGLINDAMPYGFSDLYAKATQSVGQLGSFSAAAYLNSEAIEYKPSGHDAGEVLFGWGSRVLGWSYRQPVSASLLVEARAGYSDFHGSFDYWEFDSNGMTREQMLDGSTLTRDILLGLDATWYYGPHRLHFGLQSDNYRFDHRLSFDVQQSNDSLLPPFDRVESAHTIASYAEGEFQIGDDLDVRLGMRHLAAGNLGDAWMPRIGLRWQPGNNFAFSASAGRFAQPLRSMRNDESFISSALAYDLLSAQATDAGLLRGDEVTIGSEWTSGPSAVRIDAYAKRTRGLMLPRLLKNPLDMPVLTVDDYVVGSGRVRGLEVLASHRAGESTFMFSYALTRAEHTAGSHTFAPRYDRRHMLDASANLPMGRAGVFSARAAWASGQPYTPVVAIIVDRTYDPISNIWRGPVNVTVTGPHNSARLPAYFRLDAGVRKDFTKQWFGRETRLTPYVQVLNVLNTRNVLFGDLVSYWNPSLEYIPQLPFFPTFGLEWRF